jgi:hypothetical protein
MLPPIPGLEFFPDPLHRYRLNGNWLARSVTGVVGHDMPAKTRERIDATKDTWLPRGLAVHAALEAHLLGEEQPDPGDYADWITPMLAHPLWDGAEVLAVEYRLCDERKSLAGSFDFLLRTARGSLVLGDLKTVGSAPAAKSRKPAKEQLGAYLAMAIDHHPQLTIDKCVTFVAGPGAVNLIANEPDECLGAWVDCWDAYQLLQPDF